MDVLEIFLQFIDQLLLFLDGLGGGDEVADRPIDVQLLTARESLGLPMTLDHCDESAELCGVAEALDLFVEVELLVVGAGGLHHLEERGVIDVGGCGGAVMVPGRRRLGTAPEAVDLLIVFACQVECSTLYHVGAECVLIDQRHHGLYLGSCRHQSSQLSCAVAVRSQLRIRHKSAWIVPRRALLEGLGGEAAQLVAPRSSAKATIAVHDPVSFGHKGWNIVTTNYSVVHSGGDAVFL